MTSSELINAIGIPTMVAALLYIGAKLNTLDNLKKEIETSIKPDLKDMRERFATLEGKAAGFFDTHSPIHLTAEGKKHLETSGLKAYIDENKDWLMAACDHTQTMLTSYDVQQIAFEYFANHDFPDEVEARLKTYIYEQGASMAALRRIGGIYFRDLCLKAHGFGAST